VALTHRKRSGGSCRNRRGKAGHPWIILGAWMRAIDEKPRGAGLPARLRVNHADGHQARSGPIRLIA